MQTQRRQQSPAQHSPVMSTGRQKQHFFQTQQPPQFFSNKVQFMQQPPVPVVQYQNIIYAEDRQQERVSHMRHPQSQLIPRRTSEEKENRLNYYGLKGNSSSKDLRQVEQNGSPQIKMVNDVSDHKKYDELRLQNSRIQIQQQKMQDQITHLLENQKKYEESETLKKIINKELTIQTLTQSKTEIVEKVVSLEESIDKLRDELLNNQVIWEQQIKKLVEEKMNQDEIKQKLDVMSQHLIDKNKQPLILQQLLIKNENEFEKFKFHLQDQIQGLNQQITEIKYATQKQSMIKSQSQQFINEQQQQMQQPKKAQQEDFEYQYSKQPQDQYDAYIKKYENFNRQVSDYLLNRKLPNNRPKSDICNVSSPLSSASHKYKENRNNFASLTVYNNITDMISPFKSDGKIESEKYVQSVIESPSIKSESDGSPMKALNEINERSPLQQSIELNVEECQKARFQCDNQINSSIDKGQMSAITEKEQEDDEVVFQLDVNGFLQNQSGQFILDESGNSINKSGSKQLSNLVK